MKAISRLAALTATVLTAAVLLTSCDNLIKLTYENGRYVDKRNNIAYVSAPIAYQPVSVGQAYAKYGDTVLYEIPKSEPTEYLTEEFSGVGSVYYADTLTLPELAEFDSSLVYICIEEAIIMQVGEIDDKADIEALIDYYVNGENTEMPLGGTASYHLKFVSDTYSWLYYDILYIEYDREHNYIYDRSTKRCVDVGRLLKTYLPDSGDEI